jgi:hypothetical protein
MTLSVRRYLSLKKKKVFLLWQNIKTKRLSKKLNYKKLELFKILKSIKNINYKLYLFKTMRIHSIFHVLLLKKVN